LKYLLTAVVWIVAILCAWGATQEWSRSSELDRHARAAAVMPRPAVKVTKLEAADYQAIQAKIAVYGSVQLEASPQGLTVVANELSDYAAWRLTLDRVLLDSPGVSWSVDYLCSGKCAGEEAHKATLTGERRSMVM
jgi:hypothetical protein